MSNASRGGRTAWHAFHDAFLSFGSPPIPLVRRAMLGEESGLALGATGSSSSRRPGRTRALGESVALAVNGTGRPATASLQGRARGEECQTV